MNWVRDDTVLSQADLDTVFKYEPKESTIIRMLASRDVCVCPRTKIASNANNAVANGHIFPGKREQMVPVH